MVAQNLYRKYGFSAAAVRRGYYADNQEDAIVMWVDDLQGSLFSDNYAALKAQLERELGKSPAKETA